MDVRTNETKDIVCSLLSAALTGCDIPAEAPLSEDAVISELNAQAVTALIGDILPRLSWLSERASKKLTADVFAAADDYYRYLYEQDRLVRLLERESIPFAVIKGTAAGYYYPRPEYRAAGDIDIIIKNGQFDDADRLLCANGYEPVPERSDVRDDMRHREYRRNGREIELHRYFSCLNDPDKAALLDRYIDGGISRAVTREVCGSTFPALPETETGLVLLGHISQHLQTGLGLRQMLDFMMFSAAFPDDENLISDFRHKAEETGLEKIAACVTGMCSQYLGLKKDAFRSFADVDGETCSRLLDYIFERGNMGQKQEGSDIVVTALMKNGGVSGIIKNLQKNGCREWQTLREHPSLKPFAWAYMLTRYAKRKKEHRVPQGAFAELKKTSKQAAASQELCTLLGVTQLGEKVAVKKDKGYIMQ